MEYCKEHEILVVKDGDDKLISLLEVLIEDFDRRQSINLKGGLTPIELLKFFMTENDLSAAKLSKEIDCSKQILSDVLNYRRKLSQDMVRKLTSRFSVSMDAFGRDYKLPEIKIVGTGKRDDLKKLRGVGVKAASILNQYRFYTFEDVARADINELMAIFNSSGLSRTARVKPQGVIKESRKFVTQKREKGIASKTDRAAKARKWKVNS
jgi:HTH-type transcriptional regulator/antitoxin HigA